MQHSHFLVFQSSSDIMNLPPMLSQLPTTLPALEGTNRRRSSTQTKQQQQRVPLPPSFQPTPYSVILGRGNVAAKSVGNQRLHVIISLHLEKYSNAKSRIERSSIVSSIIDMIHDAVGPNGGAFVKYENGQWWEVEEPVYRERVGALIRDRLHFQYKSSNKAKLAKRQAQRRATARAA